MSSIEEIATKALDTVKNTATSLLESDTTAKVVESVKDSATSVVESDAVSQVVDTVQNTMIPYLVAAGSFAYGLVFPDAKGKTSQPKLEAGPTLALVPSSTAKGSRGNTGMAFFYGIVLGMGLSHQLYKRRIFDKLRLSLFSWLYKTEDDEEPFPFTSKYRDPVQLDTLEGTPMPGSEKEDNSGILSELLSPDWALTSNLHVAMVTLPFAAELSPRKSAGVEFYYVISGEGIYFHDSGDFMISSGSAFLVDPGKLRSFSATRRGQLVLLRVTDAPLVAGYDVTTEQIDASPSSSKSLMEVGWDRFDSSSRLLVSDGLKKLEDLYTKYAIKKSDDYDMLD